MNILFFLTPKNEVDYVEENATIQEALKIMEKHHYTAIPVINRNGKYFGTLAEGDILRFIKENEDFSFKKAEQISIKNIKRNKDNSAVNINSKFENLIKKAIHQNFVPVIDDDKKFIGIITRKDIMEQWHKKYKEERAYVKQLRD